MRILVTGGAGFMGSSFIEEALSHTEVVSLINYDALTYAGNLENLEGVSNDPRYVFVSGDIRDRESVERTIQEHAIDTIVHFAAETHVDRSISGPRIFTDVNVMGTQVLLESARTRGLRFHLVSTDEVFGSLTLDETPSTEDSPYHPRNPYSASKAAANHLARSYFHTYGLPITISYASNNYGPRQFPEKMIPLFVSRLLAGENVPLYGDGSNIRHWLYVDDHARGVWSILMRGKAGESYCLGGQVGMTNRELTMRLLALCGKDASSITYVPDRPGHDFRYEIDSSKAARELGWSPQVDFDEGLEETVAWFQNQIGKSTISPTASL